MEKIREIKLPGVIEITELPATGIAKFAEAIIEFRFPWEKKPKKRESVVTVKGEKLSPRETRLEIEADLLFAHDMRINDNTPMYVQENPIAAIREALLYDKGWFRELLYKDVFANSLNGGYTDPELPKRFTAAVNATTENLTKLKIEEGRILILLKVRSVLDLLSNYTRMTPIEAFEGTQELIQQLVLRTTSKNLDRLACNGASDKKRGIMKMTQKGKYRVLPPPVDIDSIEINPTNVVLTPYED